VRPAVRILTQPSVVPAISENVLELSLPTALRVDDVFELTIAKEVTAASGHGLVGKFFTNFSCSPGDFDSRITALTATRVYFGNYSRFDINAPRPPN
jgi:hypothetical protein